MNEKGEAFFSLLISRLPSYERGKVLEKNPQSKNISFPKLSNRMPHTLLEVNSWMHKIHYSWIGNSLKKDWPVSCQSLFLTLFTHSIAHKISVKFHIPLSTSEPSKLGKIFISFLLKETVIPQTILDEELLPSTSLSALLKLSKNELIHLIDHLGMYDIAAEIRKIIDKKLLQKIFGLFPLSQKTFLKNCLQQPIKWIPPSLNLKKIQSNPKELFLILHQRGLHRLAFALSEESESLVWHLSHILDTGRGKMIEENRKKIPKKELLSYFQEQVLNTLNRSNK